jgi:enamine deaminase RidA (YjgF/YER057c/UK114 family)
LDESLCLRKNVGVAHTKRLGRRTKSGGRHGKKEQAMNRSAIVPREMQNLQQRFRYSPGVRVGNLLFLAGQVGRDDDLNVVEGKEAQFTQAFDNLNKVLVAAGATMDDVVDMVSYHTDMRDLPLFIKVRDRYVSNAERYPAWTALGVSALAMPGLIVEIKCTALVP